MSDDFTVNLVKNAAKEIGFLVIADKLSFENAEPKARQSNKGAYLLSTRYGRGFDFKLQKDAKVIIIMNGACELDFADVA